MRDNTGWWHDSSFDGTDSIQFFEEHPYTDQGHCWYGPFKSFSAAKDDALRYHLSTKQVASVAIAEIRQSKKSDWAK